MSSAGRPGYLGYPSRCLKGRSMMHQVSLVDQVAVVTGAGRGIGRAIAERLSSVGAKVAVIDIDRDLAEETESLIRKNGSFACAIVTDVSEYSGVNAAFKAIREQLGSPDILINNAGIY